MMSEPIRRALTSSLRRGLGGLDGGVVVESVGLVSVSVSCESRCPCKMVCAQGNFAMTRLARAAVGLLTIVTGGWSILGVAIAHLAAPPAGGLASPGVSECRE